MDLLQVRVVDQADPVGEHLGEKDRPLVLGVKGTDQRSTLLRNSGSSPAPDENLAPSGRWLEGRDGPAADDRDHSLGRPGIRESALQPFRGQVDLFLGWCRS